MKEKKYAYAWSREGVKIMAVYDGRGEEKLSDRAAAGPVAGREAFDFETTAVLAKIEEQLHRNFKSLHRLSEDIDDPWARGTVQRLLRDLRTQQQEVAALRQLLARYPELGNLARVRQRLNHWLRSGNARSFLWGAGLSLAVVAFLPLASKNFRPLMVRVIREIMELADRSQELVAGLKEGLEDLVSEARFEALKQSLEPGGKESPMPPGPEKKEAGHGS